MNIKRYMLVFFLYSLTHPSQAIGLAVGPSLGIAGFRTSFRSKEQLPKTSIDNLAVQMGGFARLDLSFLVIKCYAKVDGLMVLDWIKWPYPRLSNKLIRHRFQYIALPFTIGPLVFSRFRPHIGLAFRLPFYSLKEFCKSKDLDVLENYDLIKSYRKMLNSYILGLGIDLGNILIDLHCEFAQLSVARRSIKAALFQGHKHYRPKQITLKVAYNLLG